MIKLLQIQALTSMLARQNNLSYASSLKRMIFPALPAGRLHFNPSLQNFNEQSGFKISSYETHLIKIISTYPSNLLFYWLVGSSN